MRSIVVILAGALLCSMAFAAPRTLSNADLDRVAAGADTGIAQLFIDAFTNGPSSDPSTATVPTTTANPANTTGGSGSQAISGSCYNTTAGAVADSGSTAINGKDNTFVPVTITGGIAAAGAVAGSGNNANIQNAGDHSTQIQTGAISLPITDAFKNTETTNDLDVDGNGNATFVGSYDTVNNTTDNSKIDGKIGSSRIEDSVSADSISDKQLKESGGSGVIARTAAVSDAFKVDCTTNTVCTKISDSFNTKTNSMCIGGQGTVSGIVNANTLDEQNIGTNLNITSASSSVPSNMPSAAGLTTLAGFGAAAITTLTQTNVNASIGVFVGEVEVDLGGVGAATAK